jgi:hypothetical protein
VIERWYSCCCIAAIRIAVLLERADRHDVDWEFLGKEKKGEKDEREYWKLYVPPRPTSRDCESGEHPPTSVVPHSHMGRSEDGLLVTKLYIKAGEILGKNTSSHSPSIKESKDASFYISAM